MKPSRFVALTLLIILLAGVTLYAVFKKPAKKGPKTDKEFIADTIISYEFALCRNELDEAASYVQGGKLNEAILKQQKQASSSEAVSRDFLSSLFCEQSLYEVKNISIDGTGAQAELYLKFVDAQKLMHDKKYLKLSEKFANGTDEKAAIGEFFQLTHKMPQKLYLKGVLKLTMENDRWKIVQEIPKPALEIPRKEAAPIAQKEFIKDILEETKQPPDAGSVALADFKVRDIDSDRQLLVVGNQQLLLNKDPIETERLNRIQRASDFFSKSVDDAVAILQTIADLESKRRRIDRQTPEYRQASKKLGELKYALQEMGFYSLEKSDQDKVCKMAEIRADGASAHNEK